MAALYALPMLYLPVNSSLPSPPPGVEELVQPLREGARLAAEARSSLSRHVISPADRLEVFQSLRCSLHALSDSLSNEVETLQATTRTQSEAAVAHEIERELGPGRRMSSLTAAYTVQDRYFQVIRVEGMTLRAFSWQTLSLFERIVSDLGYTFLNADEAIAIVDAMGRTLDAIPSRLGYGPVRPSTPVQAANYEPDPYAAFWGATPNSEADLAGRTRTVALHRWVVGHHLWKVFSSSDALS